MNCEAKLAFDDKTAAEAGALVAEFQHGGHFKVYQCQDCGLWHIASDFPDN